jgi:predicted aspartyl protease
MRYSAILAVVAAFLGSGAQAQDCTLKQMASLDMTVLPSGLLAVPVALNDVQELFLVDTGGVFTKISAKAAMKHGLVDTNSGVELYGGGNGKLALTSANVKSFKVGNNEARNFHIGIVHDKPDSSAPSSLPSQEEGSETVGELAPDFLSLFDVEIDMAKRKLNLFSQDHCPEKVVYWTQSGYAELPFRFTGGLIAATPHIQLRMTLDGHELSAALDTGAQASFLQEKAAMQIFGIDENSAGVTKSPLTTEKFPLYRKQFGSLTLNGLTVQNPQIDIFRNKAADAFRMEHSEKSRDDPIYGTSLDMENFALGMNVLSKLHLYIAYKEHRIYLTAADAK